MQRSDWIDSNVEARQAVTARLNAPSMPEIHSFKVPVKCKDMVQVRQGVDAIDVQLVTLIARRFAYMDAAARIKDNRAAVRDEKRKAEVLGNVRRAALDQRIPQDVVAQIWEVLVEGSIAYELERWDTLRG